MEPNFYPLPHADEIFAKMANCKYFSKIDLSDAYLQFEVDDNSKQLLTINTQKGLYIFNRLPPGVTSAPGAFQKAMDTILAGLDGVFAYLDDVIIASTTTQENAIKVKEVMERFKEHGLTIRWEKCEILKPSIKYLGHVIDSKGIHPDPSKVESIQNMPRPTNVSELRSFLGAINYYDASTVGIGAQIFHKMPDGTRKAIYHVSRALTSAEQKYSQIEKEALALVYGCTKFHRMIYGRSFTLLTDHKPLLSIFGSKKGIPTHTANRLQRWALIMMSYDFTIQYVNTNDFGNVDILSRLINNQPQNEEFVVAVVQTEDDLQFLLQDNIKHVPVTHKMVVIATAKDTTLRKVIQYIQDGWPSSPKMISSYIEPYYNRRESLSIVDNCIMSGDRVVIPAVFHKRILRQLHKGHQGVERMKSLARSYVYWPKIDAEISENL
ncbi:Retrovirus-related Pol polyprotein from transposon 17.6 [Lucilia cuprina]|nr:Retrovirus-related Pol polyprotein from transposon 17.6 [Lucilia cuprina]